MRQVHDCSAIKQTNAAYTRSGFSGLAAEQGFMVGLGHDFFPWRANMRKKAAHVFWPGFAVVMNG